MAELAALFDLARQSMGPGLAWPQGSLESQIIWREETICRYPEARVGRPLLSLENDLAALAVHSSISLTVSPK